jgi:RNA polymerase sigma factor (sigma-70 family)
MAPRQGPGKWQAVGVGRACDASLSLRSVHGANPFRALPTINGCMEMTADAPWTWWPATSGVASTGATPPRATLDTDEALMLRYRDGDEAAFRLLYQRYRGPLLRFSQRLTGRANEAEEIFQETWIAVIDSRARYSVRARFVTWLFAIAHRRAADGRRRRARRPLERSSDFAGEIEALAEPALDPSGVALADERGRALQAAIARLPLEQREVFLLRAETGLGVREIAAITHALPETTKSRLRYALRQLREAMSAWT